MLQVFFVVCPVYIYIFYLFILFIYFFFYPLSVALVGLMLTVCVFLSVSVVDT